MSTLCPIFSRTCSGRVIKPLRTPVLCHRCRSRDLHARAWRSARASPHVLLVPIGPGGGARAAEGSERYSAALNRSALPTRLRSQGVRAARCPVARALRARAQPTAALQAATKAAIRHAPQHAFLPAARSAICVGRTGDLQNRIRHESRDDVSPRGVLLHSNPPITEGPCA
jgi:hypothetical protein